MTLELAIFILVFSCVVSTLLGVYFSFKYLTKGVRSPIYDIKDYKWTKSMTGDSFYLLNFKKGLIYPTISNYKTEKEKIYPSVATLVLKEKGYNYQAWKKYTANPSAYKSIDDFITKN